MDEQEFLRKCDEKLKDLHPGALAVIFLMGPKVFAEDHIMCAACKDRKDAKCPAVEACNDLLAIAQEAGQEGWVI